MKRHFGAIWSGRAWNPSGVLRHSTGLTWVMCLHFAMSPGEVLLHEWIHVRLYSLTNSTKYHRYLYVYIWPTYKTERRWAPPLLSITCTKYSCVSIQVCVYSHCTIQIEPRQFVFRRRVSILAQIRISAGRSGPPNQDRVWAGCGNARVSWLPRWVNCDCYQPLQ